MEVNVELAAEIHARGHKGSRPLEEDGSRAHKLARTKGIRDVQHEKRVISLQLSLKTRRILIIW